MSEQNNTKNNHQQPMEVDQSSAQEEMKPRYACGRGGRDPGNPMGDQSAFLYRLNKRQKFFDSGDYQMAKQKKECANNQQLIGTGDAIPTPETVPVRKAPIIQPSKFNPNVQ